MKMLPIVLTLLLTACNSMGYVRAPVTPTESTPDTKCAQAYVDVMIWQNAFNACAAILNCKPTLDNIKDAQTAMVAMIASCPSANKAK